MSAEATLECGVFPTWTLREINIETKKKYWNSIRMGEEEWALNHRIQYYTFMMSLRFFLEFKTKG